MNKFLPLWLVSSLKGTISGQSSVGLQGGGSSALLLHFNHHWFKDPTITGKPEPALVKATGQPTSPAPAAATTGSAQPGLRNCFCPRCCLPTREETRLLIRWQSEPNCPTEHVGRARFPQAEQFAVCSEFLSQAVSLLLNLLFG